MSEKKITLLSNEEIAKKQAIIYAKELNLLYKEEKKRREQLEEALRKLKDTQEELIQSSKLAAVGQLAAGVAHELNSPLTAIMGYAELIKEQPKDITMNERASQIIIQESTRIANLVKELLSFSRKQEPKFEKISINEVLKATLVMTEHTLSRFKKVEIKTIYNENIPDVFIDKNQVQQIFINMMMNAAQAMPQGGNLTIRTGLGYEDYLPDVYNEEGNVLPKPLKAVYVEFADTGCGIPKNVLQHIFEAFFTTKESGKGTGLGLSICKGIIDKHQGAIKVESKVGEGTTFFIIFPVKE